jgi:hypothetical protein
MIIKRLKFTKVIGKNPFLYDYRCGKYKIDSKAYNLYYDGELYSEAYDDDGGWWDRIRILKQSALEHANNLLKQTLKEE